MIVFLYWNEHVISFSLMSLLNYKRLNRMNLTPTAKRIIKQNQACPCRRNSVRKYFLFIRNGRLGKKTKISLYLIFRLRNSIWPATKGRYQQPVCLPNTWTSAAFKRTYRPWRLLRIIRKLFKTCMRSMRQLRIRTESISYQKLGGSTKLSDKEIKILNI